MANNLKPFNLKEAKTGAPMVTRGGCKAVFITYDEDLKQPLVCKVFYDDSTGVESFFVDGKYLIDRSECRYDLFMAIQKKTVWVNFYGVWRGFFYDTEREADSMADPSRIGGKAYPVEIDV